MALVGVEAEPTADVQALRQSRVHQQQTSLDSPESDNRQMFSYENKFGSIFPRLYFLVRHVDFVARVNKVCRSVGLYPDNGEQNGVYDEGETHEPIVELQGLEGFVEKSP